VCKTLNFYLFLSRPIYESGDSFALSRQQAKNIIQDLLDLRESNRVQLLGNTFF